MTDEDFDEMMANTDWPAERKRAAVILFGATCFMGGLWLRHRDAVTLALTVLFAAMLALMLWRIHADDR